MKNTQLDLSPEAMKALTELQFENDGVEFCITSAIEFIFKTNAQYEENAREILANIMGLRMVLDIIRKFKVEGGN